MAITVRKLKRSVQETECSNRMPGIHPDVSIPLAHAKSFKFLCKSLLLCKLFITLGADCHDVDDKHWINGYPQPVANPMSMYPQVYNPLPTPPPSSCHTSYYSTKLIASHGVLMQ